MKKILKSKKGRFKSEFIAEIFSLILLVLIIVIFSILFSFQKPEKYEIKTESTKIISEMNLNNILQTSVIVEGDNFLFSELIEMSFYDSSYNIHLRRKGEEILTFMENHFDNVYNSNEKKYYSYRSVYALEIVYPKEKNRKKMTIKSYNYNYAEDPNVDDSFPNVDIVLRDGSVLKVYLREMENYIKK
jgi:hypothetical protein